MKRFIYFAVVLFGALVLVLSSCEKEDTGSFVQQAEATSTCLQTDMEALQMFSLFHKALHDTALVYHDTAVIDSALVMVEKDTLTGIRQYTFDYGSGQTAPDGKTRSGRIQATLDKDFDTDDATFSATLDGYSVDANHMSGTVLYKNTGQVVAGEKLLTLTADLTLENPSGINVMLQSEKNINWTKGLTKLTNWSVHEFTLSGNATCFYTNAAAGAITDASVKFTTANDWELRMVCSKLVKSGTIDIIFSAQEKATNLTGTFIDADLDNCSDKVMIKNQQNFGYPFYL